MKTDTAALDTSDGWHPLTSILWLAVMMVIMVMVFREFDPTKTLNRNRNVISASEEYEASVWCQWRNHDGPAYADHDCLLRLIDTSVAVPRIQEPGVLSEIVQANAAWARTAPQRYADYLKGRAENLAADAERAKVRAAALHAKVDVAIRYTDEYGCEHRIGSDGRERDRFSSFVGCSKRRLGLS